MKKYFIAVALLLAAFACPAICYAQQSATPELEFAFELKVNIDGAFNVGAVPHGDRVVIPITGGTFEGPGIKGDILPGGADYQMGDRESGRTEVEAIYCIRTDDGVSIHVRNWGIICGGQDGFYFTTSPKFEAPKDSKYNWLNNKIFVCRPDFTKQGYLSLNVWYVK